MKFNKNKCSKRVIAKLSSLGVFPQMDGSIAVSEYLPNNHIKDYYLKKFDSPKECLDYLNVNFNKLENNFISIWKLFEEECVGSLRLEEVESPIKDEIVVSSINALVGVSRNYEPLKECLSRLRVLRKNIPYIKKTFRKKLSYYATLIDHLEAEMVEEFLRIKDIEIIIKLNKNANSNKIKKLSYQFGNFGASEGGGPSGRNSLQSVPGPFSNFDYYDGRVGDGRDIGEGKGEATEKFKETNKFKRHPDLLLKKNFRYRSEPTGYMSEKVKRRLNRKNKPKDGDYILQTNGRVKVDVTTDPTYINWWETNNNPYLFSNRENNGPYPSWEQYR